MTGFSRIATATAICALSLTACGSPAQPLGGGGGTSTGFPLMATKNTTRIAGSGLANRAAAVSSAVWPGAGQRPNSVVLLPGDWQSALAAAPLAAPPFNAAFLMADGEVPDVTSSELDRLDPIGVASARNVKRIRIGDAADPGDSSPIDGTGPAGLADAVDQSRINAGAQLSPSVVVVGTEAPEWAMPAAAYSARSGDPVLFAGRNAIPSETVAAIRRRGKPLIILLAPVSVVSGQVEAQLSTLGAVTRVTGPTPSVASVAFARFRDGDSGWGLVDPGHGFLFVNSGEPMDAMVAAPLSSSGTWPATLLLESANALPQSVNQYLRDVQPGFRENPTRAVYNRGWLLGDTDVIDKAVQAEIDALLEIVPANEKATR